MVFYDGETKVDCVFNLVFEGSSADFAYLATNLVATCDHHDFVFCDFWQDDRFACGGDGGRVVYAVYRAGLDYDGGDHQQLF